MVNIYNNIKDENGIESPNRVRLFITKTDEEGNISEFLSGNSAVPMTNGTLFIVDDWLISQIDKVQFKDGTLSVVDGEELIPPVKTERELQRESLLKQLAELESEVIEEKEEEVS